MGVQSGTHDEANALALMSTDVNNLESVGEMIHETWAQFFEVIIGTCLLASQIGWLCLVPYLIIIVCSRVSHYVATNLKSKQRNWSIATQARIGMTASMLSAAKSMKMLGMVGAMTLMIEELREQELEMYKKLRWVMVIYNSSGESAGIRSRKAF
jgi:ATP-binding cassette subfamily C (CFTR/MRP) protein 1